MTERYYTITGLQSELKKAEQRGIDLERERIIKLLESIDYYPKGWDYNDPIASVIALIKGEN